ncbi:Uncharacterized transporter C11D3.18C [Serendipita indica DSM 11827]|uniref:Related to putative tartrate transporter n=1 Tax=Serendipita indica (strain DSM 11827) TaxID=1109443 RepID=G4T4Y5_SERID|nr:Uncharacterized transporter C11D3.18C [Serendipita indica DSM 11827]CCA66419.1 related to putative tartrate transporter [Serendipita indica DSM 11827]
MSTETALSDMSKPPFYVKTSEKRPIPVRALHEHLDGDIEVESRQSVEELVYVPNTAVEKRMIRKVDLHLIPILGALYSFALIDRSNLGYLYVSGMDKDLEMYKGSRYSICLTAFFIPYIMLEIPANIAIRIFGASRWLSTIALLWGITMFSMSFINTWQGIAGTRALLGALEAGFFPACAYLISCWYTRKEMQLRLACFYLMSVLAGGFASILSYGLYKLDGRNGRAGWRWILFVEGLITAGLAIAAYLLIADFPDKNRFLSVEETKLVIQRINADRGDAEYDQMTWSKLRAYLCDFKIWVFGLLFFGSTVPSYAIASFSPIILMGQGHSIVASQLLSAPPFCAAVVYALISAYACDKTGARSAYIIGQAILCVAGLMMIGYAKTYNVRYAGLFLSLMGCQANIPAVLAYQSTNIVRQSKRAISNATVIAFGGVGGIYSAFTFRSQDSPDYIPGLWATCACEFLIVALTLWMAYYFARENRKLKRKLRGPIEGTEGFYFTI